MALQIRTARPEARQGLLLCAGAPATPGAQEEMGWAGRTPADSGQAKVQVDPEPINALKAALGRRWPEIG